MFYSYSHADLRMLDRLRTHLSMLRRRGLITEWCDRDIEAGAAWREEIARELQAADVILLLVSPDFIASDFCYEREMMSAVERAKRGEVTVIGMMLRPVDDWQNSPFADFQLVPSNARPISSWSNVDQAYAEVAASIRKVLEDRVRSSALAGLAYDADIPRPAELAVSVEAAARGREVEKLVRDCAASVGDFVILTGDTDANYFAQCIREEDGFWCEAVSNAYLDAPHRLGAAQTARLAAFGWNPPERGLFNWWCVREDPVDVAALMVRTLNEVFGVPLDVPFQLDSGSRL